MRRALVLLALATSIGAQQPQGQPNAAARAAVQNFVGDYIEAHNKADATSLAEAMSRRPEVSSVSDGDITRGWEAIRKEVDEITGMEGRFKVAVGTMDVTMLGASYALVVAPTSITATTPQGQSVQLKGAVTLVLERVAGGWKILNEHYSTKPAE